MSPPFLVLVSVRLDQERLPSECRSSLYGRQRIRRNAKDAATTPVYQSEDCSDQQMRGADEAECAAVNALAHERSNRAGEAACENDDIEIEGLHSLVRDEREMLPSVVKAFLISDARFRFFSHVWAIPTSHPRHGRPNGREAWAESIILVEHASEEILSFCGKTTREASDIPEVSARMRCKQKVLREHARMLSIFKLADRGLEDENAKPASPNSFA